MSVVQIYLSLVYNLYKNKIFIFLTSIIFAFVLFSNLMGLVPYSFTTTSLYLNFNSFLFCDEFFIVLTFLFFAILSTIVIMLLLYLVGIEISHKKMMHFFYASYSQLYLSLYYVKPYHIILMFAIIIAMNNGLDMGIAMCSPGNEIQNSNLETLLSKVASVSKKTPADELSKTDSFKADDLDSITEKKSSIDKKVSSKQNSAIKPDSTLESFLKELPEDLDLPSNFRIALPDNAFTQINPSSSEK